MVVGSGFIGCEAAASLSLRGAEVTLISLEDSPQRERLGPEVGGRIEGWLEGYGVELRLGTASKASSAPTAGTASASKAGTLSLPGPSSSGPASSPVPGSRRRPVLRWTGGVITDSSMRTSAPGIFAVGDIAQAYNESAGRHLSVEHWGDALEHGRVAGTVIAGGDAAWSMAPGFWSTIGDKTLKYWAWGDGWDELRFEENSDSFTVWYGQGGTLVGVLTHGADEDYEKGRELIERGAPLPE